MLDNMQQVDGVALKLTPDMVEAGAIAMQEWQNSSEMYDAGAIYVLHRMLRVGGIQIDENSFQLAAKIAQLGDGDESLPAF